VADQKARWFGRPTVFTTRIAKSTVQIGEAGRAPMETAAPNSPNRSKFSSKSGVIAFRNSLALNFIGGRSAIDLNCLADRW
jgi:hypothetical protein